MDPGNRRASGSSKRADYYGTFLEAVREDDVQQGDVQQGIPSRQRLPQRDASPGPDTTLPQADAAAEEEVVDPIELLRVLRDSGGMQGMSKLQATTNLHFSRFAEVVAKLEEAGLLKITGTPGSEKVELMPAGATLADLG